jgi:hypothetical protein
MSELSPVSGSKRKLDFGAVPAVFDLNRTLGPDGHRSNKVLYWRLAPGVGVRLEQRARRAGADGYFGGGRRRL